MRSGAKSNDLMDPIDMIDLRAFDLNLLVAFDALVSERSVSGAARRVGIGQPAMSHALRRLREAFGDPLLVRHGSTMRPTARALELATSVERVLEDIRRSVLADQAFRPDSEARVFRIGTSDFVMTAVLPKLLAKLSDLAPLSRVVASGVARDEMAAKLANASIDLAIGFRPDAAASLETETLFHEDHVCLYDAEACGFDRPITLEDYLSLPHYLVTSRGDFRGVVDARLDLLSFKRFVQLSISSFLAVPFLLRGSRAVAIVPARLARHCREVIGLSVAPPPVAIPGFDVAMVWDARTEADPAMRWFRERVREAVAEA
jgi:DNA-binding transcriptional LysR family regulator